jgi:ribosomal protein S24E
MSLCVNIFSIFINDQLNLLEDDRKKYHSLEDLRKHFTCNFYAEEDKVYAYGKTSPELSSIGFRPVRKTPQEIPKTTCRIILEGFCNRLASVGYSVEPRGFRMQAFDTKNPIPLNIKELVLLKGCELRTVYLKDVLSNNLVFGLIMDLKFKFEYEGKTSSYSDIRRNISQKYGFTVAQNTIREIRVKTGDLTPAGKVNAQSSKFHYDNILSIIKEVGNKIELPTHNEAIVSLQPTPIIIGV